MQDKVSIIIPLYNRQELVLETIASLQNQTYKNWEAVIVDDGSTDNSYSVVLELSQKEKKVKVLKRNREPKGAPTCRNIGIQKASGKYILFLDSDDVLASYCIEERVKYFKENSKLDFLVFNGAFFENKPGDTDILWNKFSEDDDFDRFLSGDVVWSMSGSIWQKKSLLKHKLFFNELAQTSQDWEFHIKALQKKMSYKKIDVLPDYFVRRSPSQASNAISSEHNKLDKIINRIELFGILFNDNKKLPKIHKIKLFKNIYFQIFSIYTTCSFSELNLLFKKTKSIKLSNKLTISFWHLFLKLFLFFYKIGIRKAHIVAYFLSRKILSKNNKSFYRIKMDTEILIKIKQKY